jgi:hypothetical protein
MPVPHKVGYQRILIDLLEDQTFPPKYNLAHPPPPPPPFPVSKLDRRHTGLLRKRDNLLTTGGGRQIIRRRESWSSMNHSILSVQNRCIYDQTSNKVVFVSVHAGNEATRSQLRPGFLAQKRPLFEKNRMICLLI